LDLEAGVVFGKFAAVGEMKHLRAIAPAQQVQPIAGQSLARGAENRAVAQG